MAINARLITETANTSGYNATITDNGTITITTPDGRPVISGYLTKNGRLEATCYTLRRKLVTLTDIGQALDDLKEQNQ